MRAVTALFSGTGLLPRILRSSALTVLGFGGAQFLRLASNLILARLLFPEAFGIMAIVSVVVQGLMLFSDVGITPAIMQSKRGDDRAFLDTAWTIQALRGGLLFAVACALAWPLAQFYAEPLLAKILPVAGLSLLITGFNPTAIETAKRHLQWGRLTVIDFTVQIAGIALAVTLAWWWQSVWALVVSGVASSVLALGLYHLALPDPRNRPRIERTALRELVQFGKWIFLSTICGFVFIQSDKIILGKALSFEVLGIYNIGFYLASFPMLLGQMFTQRLLIPIYRELPPGESAENFAKLRRMRFLVTTGLIGLTAALAFPGVWLVEMLYDDRYTMAGAVVVVMAAMQIPQIIVMTYDQAAPAAGDTRSYFLLRLAMAGSMVTMLLLGLHLGGLLGALLGYGASSLLAYPVAVWLARRMRAWDPLHDASMMTLGGVVAVVALWINRTAVADLATLSGW
ncbi:oligosaccharide flippase family protein [Roseovarius sp. MBR-6]|jgi:O-antigen/teichoic acid export membrane protein|uniref:oligosaccharide flippase family protein n=1 Tax=Roseovarius sp. MBR-6 TaxID=3156459 RepID=UPI00339A9DC2